ncbi:hypothetical protein BKA69DRAFT_1168577 [Paraphysoderma sedebokerense]|nr:hypothetical protein BKA69DRAFT_1168577 [Paraphysoderma sedebokerense]
MSSRQTNDPRSQVPFTPSDTAEGRSERQYKAAAHNVGNTEEGRLHAAEKLAEKVEQRTGEKIDPKKEAQIGAERQKERGD